MCKETGEAGPRTAGGDQPAVLAEDHAGEEGGVDAPLLPERDGGGRRRGTSVDVTLSVEVNITGGDDSGERLLLGDVMRSYGQSACKYGTLIAYVTASISMTCYNKYILSSSKFHFPLFLSMLHMIFTTLAAHTLVYIRDRSALGRSLGIERPNVQITTRAFLTTVCPIGLFFAAMLGLTNGAMQYITLSLQAMLKKLSILLVMSLSFSTGTMPFSWYKVGAAVLCTVGLGVATWHEADFSLHGTLLQVTATCCDALRLTFINLLLVGTALDMGPLTSLYYFAPCCLFFLCPVFILVEYPYLEMDDIIQLGPGLLAGNVVLAFLVNISVVAVIGRFSAVTLTFSCVAKDIVLITMSVMFFGKPVNGLQVFGFFISVMGAVAYKEVSRLNKSKDSSAGTVQQARQSKQDQRAAACSSVKSVISSSSSKPSALAAAAGIKPSKPAAGGTSRRRVAAAASAVAKKTC